MIKLWHYAKRPNLFKFNSWEVRKCGDDEEEDRPPERPAPPAVPTLPTADELFNQAISFAREKTPLAYGARESALGDINKGTSYYEQFQPTSFEQALTNQYFQNVMPDIERSINQQASLRGLEGTVVPIEAIAKQRGNLGVSIGEYLANLGNQRATASLNARNIDPYSTYQNYLGTNTNQQMAQINANYQREQQAQDIAYQNALDNYYYNQGGSSGMATGIGSVIGGGIGLFGGPGMAALGAGLGGGIGSLFEPNTSSANPYVTSRATAPISFGDALSAYSTFGSPSRTNTSSSTPFYGQDFQNSLTDELLQKQLFGYQPGRAMSVYS